MRRFPISGWAWLFPPLWPILIVIGVLWLMTFWATWLIYHRVFTLAMVISDVYDPTNEPRWYTVFWIGLFLAHLAFYIWAQIALSRGRRQRDITEAHQRAAQEAYLRWQWEDYYLRLDLWNATRIYQQRVAQERASGRRPPAGRLV